MSVINLPVVVVVVGVVVVVVVTVVVVVGDGVVGLGVVVVEVVVGVVVVVDLGVVVVVTVGADRVGEGRNPNVRKKEGTNRYYDHWVNCIYRTFPFAARNQKGLARIMVKILYNYGA